MTIFFILGPFLDHSWTVLGLFWDHTEAIVEPYWDHTGTTLGPSWDHPSLFFTGRLRAISNCQYGRGVFFIRFQDPQRINLFCEKFVVLCFDDFFFFVFYRQNARGSSTHWQLPKGNTRQKWQNLSERKRKSRRKTYACKEDFNWKWKDEKPSVGKLN